MREHPHLPKGFFHDKLVLADNSVLAAFVDSGHAELLYQIAGCVWVAPSIIDPGINPDFTKLTTADWRKLPEFVRHIAKSPPPPQGIIERRLIYLKNTANFGIRSHFHLMSLNLWKSIKKLIRKSSEENLAT
jgi:hypothetical protein